MDKRLKFILPLIIGTGAIVVANWNRGADFIAIVLIWFVYGYLMGWYTRR